MAIAVSEIPETYNSITRPIIVNLIRDLINRLGLPNDTKVKYSGSAQAFANAGSKLADSNNNPSFGYDGKVDVSMEEEYLDEYAINTNIKNVNTPIIFNDSRLNLYMRPVHTRTKLTLSLTYATDSRREAEVLRDRLRRKTSEGLQGLLHEVSYEYHVPYMYYNLLREIHTLREAVAGYGEIFEDWLLDCFDPRMTKLSNLDGTSGLATIQEKQMLVQGYFDFEAQPDTQTKANEQGEWEVNLSYVITYDKVTAMLVNYPIVVHNQMIDMLYIPNKMEYDPYAKDRAPSLLGDLAEFFSVVNYKVDDPYRGLVIPWGDDWINKTNNKNFFTIFRALIAIDINDPTLLMNLRDIPDYQISESVLLYIKNHRTKINLMMANVFNIKVWRNNGMLGMEEFYLDEELNIRTKEPMELRSTYRVALQVVNDLRILRKEAQDSLRNHPDILLKVVGLLQSLFGVNMSPHMAGMAPTVAQTHDVGSRRRNPSRIQHTRNNPSRQYPFNEVQTKSKDLTDYIVVIGNQLVTKASFEEVTSRLPRGPSLSKVGQGRGLMSVMNAGILVSNI